MVDKKKEGYGVLWRIIKPVKQYIYSAMALTALGSIATIFTLLMLSLVVAVLLHDGERLLFWGVSLSLANTLIGVGVVGALAFTLSLLGTYISHLGAFKLEEKLRIQLARHMADLPLGFTISTGTGALKNVMLEDVRWLHVFVADSTPTFGRAYTAPIVTAILMLVIDWRLALGALGVLILGMSVMRLVMRDPLAVQEAYENAQAQINAAVIEFIQAMAVVRIFDDGKISFKRYQTALDGFLSVILKWTKAFGLPARISLVILAPLPTVAVILTGGIVFIGDGSLSLPALVAMLFLSTGMVDAFMPLMWLNNFLRKSKTAANRIEEILGIPAMPVVETGETPKEMRICFEGVTFRYEGRSENALTDVNFRVEPGTTTALVGPSGAGKSTVAKLLPRFWDISDGSITIGGVDIRNMTNEALMNTVTFVFQDTYLFNDTLANNIRMAKPGATDEEMMHAAKAAQIHAFIMSLPDGYETYAGDRGAKLSGGQRQRITIARAILRNTPIVVLDEATAFADPECEEEIIRAIAHLTRDKTVIIIAHRLSTITRVDQILVFDQGRVAEQGKHDDLVLNNGLYAKLWADYSTAQTWNLHAKGSEHGQFDAILNV